MQNGVVERKFQTLYNRLISTHKSSGLTSYLQRYLWDECALCVTNLEKICQRSDETSNGIPSDHLGPKTWNQRPKDQGSRSKAKTRKAFSPSSYHRGRSPRAGGAGGMREALTIIVLRSG